MTLKEIFIMKKSKIYDIIGDIEKFHNMELPIKELPFLEYKQLPKAPGVYHIFNKETGEELYSGKTKNLRERQIPHYNKAFNKIESTASWKDYLDNNDINNCKDWVIYYIEVYNNLPEITISSIEGNLKFKLKGLMNDEVYKDNKKVGFNTLFEYAEK